MKNCKPCWALFANACHSCFWLWFVVVAFLIGSSRSGAFSFLCGPCQDCPDAPYSVPPGDIGPAANLGEEYRWNVPVLVYAFDSSFVDYFGSGGIAAVEEAISILNALPPASQINLSNFPTESASFNYTAQALGLLDVKSLTLALLLEQLGLAQPTRHVFDLREWNGVLAPPSDEASWPPGTIPNLIIERNFDPAHPMPSHYVNGVLYSGAVVALGALVPKPEFAEVVEFPVDPLSPAFTAVADRALSAGMFYTGLTRDDVGGLGYLLRTNNLNLEMLLPDVHGIGTNAGAYVTTALRPGVDKILFVRREYDSFLRQFLAPFTNQFTDIYITNNEPRQQRVERVVTQPDIVFTAIAPPAGERSGQWFSRSGTSNWWNSASVAGLPGITGPGVIRPRVEIALHKSTPMVRASDDSAADTAQVINNHWGSFDHSTNPPVAYPVGTTPGDGPLMIRLFVHPSDDDTATLEHVWELPVAFGGSAALEMSADLTTWTRLTTVTNLGEPVEWDHTRSQDRKFYRALPQ